MSTYGARRALLHRLSSPCAIRFRPVAGYPHLSGTLFELDYVIDGARKGPLAPHLASCAFESGDMFKAVPAGRDAHLMKLIIHDWTDQACVELLRACRRAVNPWGRLLLADAVIHPGNDFERGKFLDLQMMLFPSGRERTETEFAEIFAAAGWKLSRIIDTKPPDSIVEGVPPNASCRLHAAGQAIAARMRSRTPSGAEFRI